MNWVPYGPHAWLLRFADRVGEDAFYRGRSILTELQRHPPGGLVEIVPGLTSILLEFDPREKDVDKVILPEFLRRLDLSMVAKMSTAPLREIQVQYDGPDLERVASLNELTVREVIAIHAAPIYRVYMIGFAPGFPYLGDLDPQLHTPRLSSPRMKVTAGSVGIGGEHTGIYPVEGPGGWNILGHTAQWLFDPERGRTSGNDEESFFLRPGDRVRFIPTD
jgi:inhibitor of KinA